MNAKEYKCQWKRNFLAKHGYSHSKTWNEKNREKRRAQKMVENAIARGKMNRMPCEICGATEHVHAHHDDYSRPLDVMWLCAKHHKERHKELAAGVPVASAAVA
jgi:hypothetical protein